MRERLRIAESLQPLRGRLAKRAIGTEEHPDDVLRAQVLPLPRPRQQLIPLVGRRELFVREFLERVFRL
jgi:hypothetical protein